MKQFITLLLLILITSCGEFTNEKEVKSNEPERDNNINDVDSIPGPPCTVESYEDGATIICPDGTSVEIYNGRDGLDGLNGTDGQAGENGKDGTDGQDGDNTADLIYVGYYCSRTVLRLGDILYVIHGAMIPLSNDWLKISNTCSMRMKKNLVETKLDS